MIKTKKIPKENTKSEEQQLSLGLKSPFKNFFYDIKSRIVSRFSLFEANTYINDPLIWFLSSLQIVGSFYLMVYILNALPKLPSLLPLFGYTNIIAVSLVPKWYFFVFPLLTLFIFMITFRTARSSYFKNSAFSGYILFIGALITLSICLYLVKMISIYV